MADNKPTDIPESGNTPTPIDMGERVDQLLDDNPTFIDPCAAFARTYLLNTGATQVGMQAVIERVRWERSIQLKTDSFKVNNSFGPYLARAVMVEHPDLTDCFVTRRTDAADEWVAQCIARTHAEEFGVDEACLFTIDLPRQRTRNAR